MGRTPTGQTRKRILEYVRRRLMEGSPPTVREVREAFGFRAVQTAREHLEKLVAEGLLAKDRGKARGYRLPGDGGRQAPMVPVPLLGRVSAGSLTTAVEDLEGYIRVEASSAGDELFALRVRGESMTGAGIFPGDIAVVRRQPKAESGDIVVALLDDEATVKRLRLDRGKVELLPENEAYDPIRPDPDRLLILGKVIEIRRRL